MQYSIFDYLPFFICSIEYINNDSLFLPIPRLFGQKYLTLLLPTTVNHYSKEWFDREKSESLLCYLSDLLLKIFAVTSEIPLDTDSGMIKLIYIQRKNLIKDILNIINNSSVYNCTRPSISLEYNYINAFGPNILNHFSPVKFAIRDFGLVPLLTQIAFYGISAEIRVPALLLLSTLSTSTNSSVYDGSDYLKNDLRPEVYSIFYYISLIFLVPCKS